jgi:hypothetical protein
MVRGQKPPQSFRDSSPCDGCTEKFTACHSRCPKDLRGEFGYEAWKAKCREIDQKRKEYLEAVRRRKRW